MTETIDAPVLPTLAEEIMAQLESLMVDYPAGVPLQAIGECLGSDAASVRRAMLELDSDGLAILVSRKRKFYLVPVGFPVLACKICHREFVRGKKSKRVTCTRSCAIAMSWQNPETARKRTEAITINKRSPESRENQRQRNYERWERPGEREKLAERNRARGRDEAYRAKLRVIHGTPEMRKAHSEWRKNRWQDKEYRENAIAAMRKSRATPEVKARLSAAMKKRWQDPVQRERMTEANKKRAANSRGKKQNPEHVKKRIEAVRRTKLANGTKQSEEHIRKRVESTKKTMAARRDANNE